MHACATELVLQALAFMDADGSGWLSREEFKSHLKTMNLLSYKDKKTSRLVKGPLVDKEVRTLARLGATLAWIGAQRVCTRDRQHAPIVHGQVDGLLDIVDIISQQRSGTGNGDRIDCNAMARIFEADQVGHIIDCLLTAGV